MAILDQKNFKYTRTGVLWEASLDTPWPVSTDEVITAPWKSWGFLGVEGIGEEITRSEEPVRVFQKNEEVDTLVTEAGATYTVPVMETRKHIIETLWGTVVSPDGSYTIDPAAKRPRRKFVWEAVNLSTMQKTVKLFVASVTDIGGVNYTSTEAIIVSPTLKVFGNIMVLDDQLKETSAPEVEE